MARIPIAAASTSDRVELENLDRDLKQVVYGQDEAIATLVRAIKRAGRLQMLELTATTSSRRYLRGGALRTVLQHQRALLGWWLGWDRARLAERTGR